MNAGSRPMYVLSHLGHRVGAPETKRFAVRCSVCSAVSRITVADSGTGFALAFFAFASFMSAVIVQQSVSIGKRRAERTDT